MKVWVAAWGPAAAWAAFLFFLSSRESFGLDLTSGLDKVGHFGAYLVLGWLLARGAARLALSAWLPILIGAAYGITDELHQTLVPGRSASFGDFVADGLGSVAGVLLYFFFSRRRSARTSSAPATVLERSP